MMGNSPSKQSKRLPKHNIDPYYKRGFVDKSLSSKLMVLTLDFPFDRMHNTFFKANQTSMNALFLGKKRWQTAEPQANLQITAIELDPSLVFDTPFHKH